MSDYPVMRGSRSGDPHPTLRLAALTAVIAGVILVAVAAFLLSYEGIHQIALQAGVSPGLARLYPLMFDAMLIIACAATLALRSAGWGAKSYVWVSLLLLVGAVAVGDALHATGVRLTGQAARATIAIIPWVLLLMGFGLWLVMLRQWRRTRAMAAADGTGGGRAGLATAGSAVTAGGAAAAGGAVTWAAGRGTAPVRTGAPRSGIDALMGPRTGGAPERAAAAAEGPAAGKRGTAENQQGQQRRTAKADEHQPAAAAGTAAAGATAAGTAAAGATPAGATPAGTTPAGTTAAGTTAAGTTAAGTTAAGTTAAGTTADDGHDGGASNRTGAAGATSAGGRDDTGDAQDAGNGARAGPSASAVTEGGVTFEDLPAGAAGPKTPAGSATSGEDGETPETGARAGTGDHAGPPPPGPAPAPLPDFPRLRSTPTPPQETGADGE
jgi:hypothetical protein